MDDTGHNPGLYCSQTLGLGSICSDRVEDVDQDQEQCDQQSHATCKYGALQFIVSFHMPAIIAHAHCRTTTFQNYQFLPRKKHSFLKNLFTLGKFSLLSVSKDKIFF